MKIPNGWKISCYSDVLSVLKDGTHFSPKSTSGNNLYLTSKNIRFGKIDLTNVCYIDDEDHRRIFGTSPVQYGDVLLTKDGANTGNVAINNLKCEFSLLSSVAYLRVNPKLLINQYLLQWLLSPSVQFDIKKQMSGQAITRLTLQKISDFIIKFPPLPEQKAIADLLSTWDSAIEKTERLIAAKEKRFRWLLDELISKPSREGKWKEVKLGSLFGTEIIVEKGKALTKEGISDGNVPVVAGGQSYAYFTNESTHNFPTVTVSASGAYAGFIWYHDYSIWASDCNVLYAKNGSSKFLYFTLKNIQHKVYALQSGGAQPHVYSKDMKALNISWPSIKEQEIVVETLSNAQKEIDILKSLAEKYKEQKRGLMQKLLTGEWRVKVVN